MEEITLLSLHKFYSHIVNFTNHKVQMLKHTKKCFAISSTESLPIIPAQITRYYRMCQEMWPSLTFTDEDIEIFGLHPKVMLPQLIYALIFVVITLIGSTKVSIMKLKYTVLNRTWQHDFMMKQIFFSSVFSSENTG